MMDAMDYNYIFQMCLIAVGTICLGIYFNSGLIYIGIFCLSLAFIWDKRR